MQLFDRSTQYLHLVQTRNMPKPDRGRRAIVGWQFVFTLLSGILIPLLGHTIGKPEDSLYAYCVFASAAVLWMLWTWVKVNGTLFDPYGFVLVSAILFNLSHCVLHAVGLTALGFFDHFNLETSFQTVGAATLGIMCMHLGALMLPGTGDQRFRAVIRPGATSLRGPSVIGGAIVAVAIIPAAIETGTALAFSMSHSYGAFHLEDAIVGLDAWKRILAVSLLPGAFYFLVGRPRSRGRQLLTFACVAATALTFFFVGDRSDGTMTLVAALWLYDRAVRRVSRTFLAVLMAALLVSFPLIWITRGLTGSERLSADVWINALSKVENPVQSSVVEMGGSLDVLAYVIELVPDARGFDFGMSYLWAVGSVIPNLSGELHPSARRSLEMWLVSTVDPYQAAHGGGKGFSVLAEAYVNFGWIGIVAIMWLVGTGFARLTRWADTTHDPAVWAAIACLLLVAPKLARAESLEIVRAIVWYSVGLYAACSLLQRKQRKSQPASLSVAPKGRDFQIPLRLPFDRNPSQL